MRASRSVYADERGGFSLAVRCRRVHARSGRKEGEEDDGGRETPASFACRDEASTAASRS